MIWNIERFGEFSWYRRNADPTLSEDRVYRYLDDSQQQSIFSAALVQLAVFVCVLTWKSLSFSRSKRNQA